MIERRRENTAPQTLLQQKQMVIQSNNWAGWQLQFQPNHIFWVIELEKNPTKPTLKHKLHEMQIYTEQTYAGRNEEGDLEEQAMIREVQRLEMQSLVYIIIC